MTANAAPIYPLTPNIGKVSVTAALTKSDGTGTVGTDVFKAFTAGSNGSFVGKVRFSIAGTTASTASQGTVARVYYSTVSSGSTTGGTDTFLLQEVSLFVQTTDATANPTAPIEVVINQAIPTGSYIHVSTHAAPAANTQVHAVVFGGDY